MKKWGQPDLSPLQNIILGAKCGERFDQELCAHASACALYSQSHQILHKFGHTRKKKHVSIQSAFLGNFFFAVSLFYWLLCIDLASHAVLRILVHQFKNDNIMSTKLQHYMLIFKQWHIYRCASIILTILFFAQLATTKFLRHRYICWAL